MGAGVSLEPLVGCIDQLGEALGAQRTTLRPVPVLDSKARLTSNTNSAISVSLRLLGWRADLSAHLIQSPFFTEVGVIFFYNGKSTLVASWLTILQGFPRASRKMSKLLNVAWEMLIIWFLPLLSLLPPSPFWRGCRHVDTSFYHPGCSRGWAVRESIPLHHPPTLIPSPLGTTSCKRPSLPSQSGSEACLWHLLYI